MSTRRKADLQRKLSLDAVPAPPANLAEKIKRDIPARLPVTTAGSAFQLRIAASLIVVVASVLATVVLMTPEAEQHMDVLPARHRPVPALHRQTSEPAGETARTTNTIPAAPVAESGVREAPASAPASIARNEAQAAPREVVDEQQAATDSFAPEVAAEIAQSQPEPVTVTAAAPPPSATVAVADAAGASRASERARDDSPAPAAMKTMSITAEAPMLRMEEDAGGETMFGISLDRSVFDRIRTTIERGGTPTPEMVDVEALVNYFAGQAPRPPREGLKLELEASPIPVGSNGSRAVMRVSIDTPKSATSDASLAVATDATLEVTIDRNTVATFRPVGGEAPRNQEPVIHPNTSVTMLYELDLRPPLRAQQTVATVRLSWTSAEDGSRKTVERRITGADLSGSWARASRRHRLASLGAVWGETLRVQGRAPGLARKAEELAAQSPEDVRARELARAANALTRLQP